MKITSRAEYVRLISLNNSSNFEISYFPFYAPLLNKHDILRLRHYIGARNYDCTYYRKNSVQFLKSEFKLCLCVSPFGKTF